MKIDQIIRTRRRTIALIIQPDGSLLVRAPLRASDRQIRALVEEKSVWIRAAQEKARVMNAGVAPRQYIPGETFLYLGQSYPLVVVEAVRGQLELLDGQFRLVKSALPSAQAVFTRWYRTQARRVFEERAAWFATRYGLHYTKIRVSSARTRWGSYSAKGTVSITWRLVMAPVEIIDYVVVHELVHSLERNHGKAFWKKVAAVMPDYKHKLQWLRKKGAVLDL
jgi:predicted metal-dependent hydrolase